MPRAQLARPTPSRAWPCPGAQTQADCSGGGKVGELFMTVFFSIKYEAKTLLTWDV